MNKIKDIILEPNEIPINTGFKIKVKAIRYATYGDLKQHTCKEIKQFTVKQLKGE